MLFFTKQGCQASLVSAAVLWVLWVLCRPLFVRFRRRGHTFPLPPGPPGRLLVGNLGQVSTERPELDYIRWGKEYGEF